MGSSRADFVHRLTWDDLPTDAVRHAKRCLLDLVGVAAAGTRLSASRIIRDVAVAEFGGDAAPLLFDGRLASRSGAALANASTIDGFDAHDGHPLTKGHAGCSALAALVSFGHGADPSGRDALTTLVLGYEVAIRAGIALHATASDYHASGAWGALGVAAVGARLEGLDLEATRHALGIAEYNGPRSQMMRYVDHPTMVKDGSGWGAMVGAAAVGLAARGFTGAPAVTMEADEVAACWNDLGSRWRVTEQYLKAYPICRWAHPAMEAVAALRREHGFAPDAVRGIEVHTFREATKLAVRTPADTEEAQYSLPFPVAALLVRGRVGPNEVDGPALSDPAILRLSRAVTLVVDAEFSRRFPAERWAVATVTLADGRVLTSGPTVARGSAENPLTDEEVGAKFHVLMREAGLGDRAAAVEDLVMSLDGQPSLRPLLEAVTRPPRAG